MSTQEQQTQESQDHDGDITSARCQKGKEPKKPRPKAKRKEMAKRSDVWDHFDPYVTEKGDKKARCRYCKREFCSNPKTNGTSNLSSHLTTCPRVPGKIGSSQTILNIQSSTSQTGKGGVLGTWKFDVEEIRKSICRMIIVEELPFKFVEKPGFKDVIYKCCGPRFQLSSRRTVTRDCFQLYINEKNILKALLKSSNQRVSLTTDTWTSLQRINYMCLTAHYIDDDWKLHKKIINFCTISSHKGKDIGWEIENCLKEWELDRVLGITVDNASSNDTALSYLKEQMSDWSSTILNSEFMHMRCVAHIINLVVTDGLKEIDSSVVKVRAAVRYVRQSPARLKKFKECIEHEKIKSKSLLCLDVATRWNSTYLMLESSEKFEKAINRYSVQDPNFEIELNSVRDQARGVPSKDDWQKTRRMLTFLKVFFDLTVRISGSLYVTSNLFFHEIYLVDFLLKQWIASEDVELRAMAQKMKDKFDKYWGDPKKMNKLLFIAIVLDPRYKLDWFTYAITTMYGEVLGASLALEVKEKLFSLYDEYKKDLMPHDPNEGSSVPEELGEMDVDDPTMKLRLMVQHQYKRFKSNVTGGKSSKSEVEKFLNEETEEEGSKFDILAWWKVNSPRFPILSSVARDVLDVPISTVASESAFSTGGRVLDQFRSSLTPKVVQSLICAQDWLRYSDTPIDIEENLAELEEIGKGLQEMAFEPSTDA